ncbi:unnamed protein product (macronuclear) [Paramecium tetraurelia]|uniref:Amino acid transporter transmembrane domain-containing protein n=1 Tax=Paramecium tetraurelia TaxID=5888 RepID=A0E318_PARTE|nr:uncharacterized protein GSPATT00022858001 [Paramecium tetraurelia]CAK89685.1 unnamed protein product [Paramecium tetraurelia]|eukprot:XP_001457082.1 hypothetical protein (macronuclear) [Paramecium tetraurelia strain d4-2]
MEKQLPRSTNIQTTMKLIKVTIGSGIFAIPYAYAQAGLFWGAILQMLVCATQFISWCTMVNCLGDAKRSTLIEYLSDIYEKNSWIFLIGKIFSIILNFGCGLSCLILFQISIGSYFQNSLSLQISDIFRYVYYSIRIFFCSRSSDICAHFKVTTTFSLHFFYLFVHFGYFRVLEMAINRIKR